MGIINVNNKVFIRSFYFWFCLLVAGFFVPVVSSAKTLEVCSSCTFKTIKKGIEAALDGDVVKVKKGVYQEVNIHVNKSITLKAEPGAVIDGQNQDEILRIVADGVTIDGFEIINVGTSSLRDHAAVRIKESNNFVVQNLTIKKPFFAIFLEKSNNGIVRNNKITGTAVSEFGAGNGIHIWYSHNNKILNNEIHRMRDGIYLEFSDENTIQHNHSENNVRYGLHFMFCHNNSIKYNAFISNGAGIAIMFSKKMIATHNVFKNNWGATAYGMLLKEVFDSELSYNVFRKNTTGINVEGSNRIIYKHNDFISNGWAVNSRGANYDNKFTKNNFLSNAFDLSYNGPMNGNLFNENYWSDYNGYDLNRDGYGDVPYRPIKLFSYLVQKTPQAIILLRSMFIDIVDFSEKVSPVFTPDNLVDEKPSIKRIKHD